MRDDWEALAKRRREKDKEEAIVGCLVAAFAIGINVAVLAGGVWVIVWVLRATGALE